MVSSVYGHRPLLRHNNAANARAPRHQNAAMIVFTIGIVFCGGVLLLAWLYQRAAVRALIVRFRLGGWLSSGSICIHNAFIVAD